ncbi:MAG: DUF3159 domain-containing protein [Kineosporiaceae bacterium]
MTPIAGSATGAASTTPAPTESAATGPTATEPTLTQLLGGRSGALDASLPAAGFAAGWLAGGRDLTWAIAAAIGVAVLVSGWRLVRRRQPRAALLGLTGVLIGALVAARTGRAEDFFLVQLLANVASGLTWIVSIWFRRPFLGLVVAAVLRQGRAWRRDPVLLAGYQRASWWWVASYALRTVVFGSLWLSGSVVALGIARVALSWPLVATVIALSWATLRRHLAAHDHPGLRHPRGVAS